MFKLLIVALALVGLNQIDAFGFGTCVKSPVIADFNIAKVNKNFILSKIFLSYSVQ